jgi:cadmium resistance protein CadD (predicted permease)
MEILLTVLVAVSAFVATNLDDLFVLTIFFGSKDFNNTSVVLGQYIGVLLLIIISLLAYFFKFIIPISLHYFIWNPTSWYRLEKFMEFKKERI